MKPAIFAHRGSSSNYPENTMIAFKHALKDGADGIELDVHLTKDSIPVIIHDETVNRTTNGTGYVQDYSLKELKQLKAGKRCFLSPRTERIPTLEEVLQWISPTNLLLNIELKNNEIDYKGLENITLDLVKKYNMANRMLYSSFNHESLKRIKKLDPEAETAILYDHWIEKPAQYAKSYGASGLHPNYKTVSKSFINTMHKNRLVVRPYTINSAFILKRLIHWKVDGIITDQPKKAVKVLNKLSKNEAIK